MVIMVDQRGEREIFHLLDREEEDTRERRENVKIWEKEKGKLKRKRIKKEYLNRVEK